MRRPFPLAMVVGVVGAAFIVGVFVGSDGVVGDRALRLLAALGTPRYEAIREAYEPPAEGRSEYLLFFEGATPTDPRVRAFFSERPGLEITGPTIFDNAVVLSVPSPGKAWVEELRAQPFVWILMRDRPFFFCH